MGENSSKFHFHTRTLVTATTLALVSGCATNPFDNLRGQISSFFGGNTQAGHPGEIEQTTEKRISKASNRIALTEVDDLSKMLERVGDTALSNHSYAVAARIYGRSQGLAPNRPGPALGLARASHKIGDNQASLNAYRKVLAMVPSHPAALKEIAQELMDMGAPKDAIPYLETALSNDFDHELFNQLGIAFDLSGNHDAAQKQFRAGLAIMPDDLTLKTNLGRSLAFSGRYGEAIAALQDVANRPNATKRQREALALAQAAAGDVKGALMITKVDVNSANEPNRHARYAMIGELVRNGDPGARAELITGKPLNASYANKIQETRIKQQAITTANKAKKSDLLTILANIDAREIQRDIATSVPNEPGISVPNMHNDLAMTPDDLAMTPDLPRTAADASPKSLYQASSISPNTLNIAPSDPSSPGNLPEEPLLGFDEPILIDYEVTATNAQAFSADVGTIQINHEIISAKAEAFSANKPRLVYHVQLAAFRTVESVENGWRQFVIQAPELIGDLGHVIVRPDPKYNAGTLLRLRTAACNNQTEAITLCDSLKARNLNCIVVQSSVDPVWPATRIKSVSAPAKTNAITLANR